MAEEAAQGRASQWVSHGAMQANASARVLDERRAPAWLRAVCVAPGGCAERGGEFQPVSRSDHWHQQWEHWQLFFWDPL
jgi:hypothetical protein